jgi:hypothetical protein
MCAEIVLNEDKEDALEIAFSTYNTMVCLCTYLYDEMLSIDRSLVPLSSAKVVKGNLSGSLLQWACQQAYFVSFEVGEFPLV